MKQLNFWRRATARLMTAGLLIAVAVSAGGCDLVKAEEKSDIASRLDGSWHGEVDSIRVDSTSLMSITATYHLEVTQEGQVGGKVYADVSIVRDKGSDGSSFTPAFISGSYEGGEVYLETETPAPVMEFSKMTFQGRLSEGAGRLKGKVRYRQHFYVTSWDTTVTYETPLLLRKQKE